MLRHLRSSVESAQFMAIWMNRQKFSVPKAAAEEINTLLDHADRLQDLIAAARRHPPTATPPEVISAISAEVGVGNDILRKVFNALENFGTLTEEFGTPTKTIDEL